MNPLIPIVPWTYGRPDHDAYQRMIGIVVHREIPRPSLDYVRHSQCIFGCPVGCVESVDTPVGIVDVVDFQVSCLIVREVS